MKELKKRVGLVFLLSVLIISSGCVDKTIDEGKKIGSEVASGVGLCGGSDHVVRIEENGFASSGGSRILKIEVTRGDTITFVNKDSISHTVSITELGLSKTLNSGSSTEVDVNVIDEFSATSDVGSLTVVSSQIAPDYICGN